MYIQTIPLSVEASCAAEQSISARPVTPVSSAMTAYVIVQAESHDAAARLFENHPHFTIFPGDSIEIMECLPLPAQ